MTENYTPERTALPYTAPVSQPSAGSTAAAGYRLTAGILAVVLSFVLTIAAVISLGGGTALLAGVMSLASLGNLVAGIVTLVQHRQRAGIGPNLVLGMAIFAIAAALIGAGTPAGPVSAMFIFGIAIVTLWAVSTSIAKDKTAL